jgi:polysaccharide biosynthesis protein PslG
MKSPRLVLASLMLAQAAFAADLAGAPLVSQSPPADGIVHVAGPSQNQAPVERRPNERRGINPWEPRAFLSNIPGFTSTNVGSIRIDLPWQQVQPRSDVFNWEEIDKVVDAAQANRMNVLITLRSISSWGTRGPANPHDAYHGASLPLDMSRWETFVSTMALRYKGRNVAYEIENEPNSNFWSGTMDDYLTLLKASYAAIMRSDPQARVLSGALACHIAFNYGNAAVARKQNDVFDTWQKAILATQAFNTIGVHDYYFPDAAVNGWTFATYLTHIQDLARAAGCDKCPIWITETGYVSGSQKVGTRIDPGTPRNQAEWAARAFQQAFDLGIERTYWLFLKDHPNGQYFDSMGLLDAGGNPRPALSVIAR